MTVYEAFLRTVERTPSAVLFSLPGEADVTYGEAAERVARFAQALTSLGVGRGDRVATQTPKCADAVLLYLATLHVGGVYLPLNTAYTHDEIDYFLGDAAPTVFVVDPGHESEHRHRAGPSLSVQSLGTDGTGTLNDLVAQSEPSPEPEPMTPDEPAAILYTSGTTGRSKGAVLTHRNLRSNAEALVECWRFTAEDVLIHALPIFHTHGLFVACNVVFSAGARMIFLPRFDVHQVVDLMPQATSLMGVPTFYTRLLGSQQLTADACAGMRLFVSGSAPLLAEHHREFTERTGHSILERYGMTETGMITSNPYGGPRKPGAVGFPLPGVAIRVVHRETAQPLDQGEVGIVEVSGPNVFAGYWQMPVKTAAEFRADGYFITGDLGRIDDEGYLCLVGRDKDLVISGGFNVYPSEVEDALDVLPGVHESAVIGLPHPDLGEGVTAVVVREAGAAISEAEILSAMQGHLARFKQPKRVLFVDELPRNVMGKVQKASLRSEHASLYVPQ